MNNPVEFIKMIRNPQQMIQQIMCNNSAMQNPIMQNGIRMMQNGDTEGIKGLVENICKERGTTVEEVRKQLGF